MWRRVLGRDNSSDEEEEYRRNDMTAMSTILHKNGLKETKANYLPEAKVIVKLSDQAKKSSTHDVSNRPMHISATQFDDKKWIPSYMYGTLSSSSKKEFLSQKADISKEPTAIVLQRWMSFVTAHAAVGIITCEQALQSSSILAQISINHGRDTAYGYAIRITEFIKNRIASRETIDVGSVLSVRQDSILSEIDRELIRKKPEKKSGTIHQDKPNIGAKSNRPKGSGKGFPPPRRGGGVSEGIDRSQDQKHI